MIRAEGYRLLSIVAAATLSEAPGAPCVSSLSVKSVLTQRPAICLMPPESTTIASGAFILFLTNYFPQGLSDIYLLFFRDSGEKRKGDLRRREGFRIGTQALPVSELFIIYMKIHG